MNRRFLRPLRTLTALLAAALPGCALHEKASIEVIDPARSPGRSFVVASDFHREHPALEDRLAADLRTELAAKGLAMAKTASEADLVILPTLGRMRSGPATTAAPTDAPPPDSSADARRLLRSPGSSAMQGPALDRRVPSAQLPAGGGQRVGLLLTAVPAKDYLDYGVNHQIVNPVWRVYVARPVTGLSWDAAAKPLIRSAAAGVASLSPKAAAP